MGMMGMMDIMVYSEGERACQRGEGERVLMMVVLMVIVVVLVVIILGSFRIA